MGSNFLSFFNLKNFIMQNITIRQLVEAWIHVSPDFKVGRRLATDEAATVQANMLGTDTSDPDAQGTAIYTELQNLPTAIASIMNHVQERADFHPATQTPEQLAVSFPNYVEEVDRTPFFALLENEQTRKKYESTDYNVLIDQVVNLYDGVSDQDKNAIKESIADMGKAVFGRESSEQWKNMFSQSTLDFSDLNNPSLYVYYTTLYMKHEKGKAEINIQEYSVNRTKYTILPDLIKANAKKLTKLDKKNIDEWLNGSASPQRPDAKLCFQVKPVAS